MEINKELKHIAEYQNSILPRHQKRTEEAIEIIANDAIESLKNGTFDFKSFFAFGFEPKRKASSSYHV